MAGYSALVFVHVLCAITAIGSNLTYPVWLYRGRKDEAHLRFMVGGLKFVDDRIATPAYILLFITGCGLVSLSHRAWSQTWITAALTIYVVVAAIGIFAYSPGLTKQLRVLDEAGANSTAYLAIEKRMTVIGAALTAAALVILALMVFRPGGN